jgi:hypothetical protein
MARYVSLVALALLGMVVAPRIGRSSQSPATLVAVTFAAGPSWQANLPPNEQPGFREHSANLARLRREERIVIGGRFGGFGLMVVRADSVGAARELFKDDPTIQNGVFQAEFNLWRTIYGGTL